MSKTILLDSSTWIEIFGVGKHAAICETERKKAQTIIVPTIVIFEVYKKIQSVLSEDKALLATAVLNEFQVENLTQEVALTAADLSIEHSLGMADAMVLAHAKLSQAKMITLDNDFANIPNVKVIR